MSGELPEHPWPQRTITQIQEVSVLNINIPVWDELAPYLREGDVVVNTFMKSGTTWMTQVILQMINSGEETLFAPGNTIHDAVPWIEQRLMGPMDGIVASLKATPPHRRRVIKSHLHLDALLFSPKVRYVCVFRDGRDVVVSFYNHSMSMSEEFRTATWKDKNLDDFNNFYDNWLNRGNRPFWTDYFHHYQSWWEYACSCDNILLVNYDEMQHNLANVVSKLAKFLDIRMVETSTTSFLKILHHSSFEYMKKHEALFELPAKVMEPGHFINKGVSGRWRNVLSKLQHQMYWEKVAQRWPPELIEFVHKNSTS